MNTQPRTHSADKRADLHFYFDPVCPFAWMTSKWVRMVAAQRDYTVDWRFISLRMINSHIDYDSHFPAGYEDGHTAGLRLLRVAARARAEHGRAAVGPLYAAIGARDLRLAPAPAGPTPAIRGTPGLPRAAARRRPACPPTWPTRSTTTRWTRRSAPRATRRWR